jgi:CofD-related protein of GAK system
MVDGSDKLISVIPDPMRKIIRNHLRFFRNAMPNDCDLRGASIGNLILAGGYLNSDRHIDPVVYTFSKLVEARGTVRTITGANLQLAARLQNGRIIIGQRNMTGKEVAPIESPIAELYLTDDLVDAKPTRAGIREKVRDLIANAELICFPMGSFFSSVIANLLPQGVSSAVISNHCPKVYVPNLGNDPEQIGLGLADCVKILLDHLRRDYSQLAPTAELLNFVVIDSEADAYQGQIDVAAIRRLGVDVIDTHLVTEQSYPLIDETRLIETLLSLT